MSTDERTIEHQLLEHAERQTALLVSIDGSLKVFFWVFAAAAALGLIILGNL
jgi:small-conductance mechanosensitive channel